MPRRFRRSRRWVQRALLWAARRLTVAAGGGEPDAAATPEAPPAESVRRELGFPVHPRPAAGRRQGAAPVPAAAVLAPAPAISGVSSGVSGVSGAAAAADAGAPALFAGRSGACVVSVCTRNYLYQARTALAAFRRHHPEMPAFLGIVDWDGIEPLAVEGTTLLPCAAPNMPETPETPEVPAMPETPAIAGPAFGYMTLKYTALELCGAIKPYVLDHVLRRTRFAKLVFIDADVLTCAPFARLLDELDRHDFVVTPHTVAPPPHPDRFWERPSLGDIAFAGPLNSGLFGLRATAAAQAFLHAWRDLVTQPGAFLPELGGQTEQNAFNWVTSFVDDVCVLRDAAYNVAYWNLHDRSLRCAGLDDPLQGDAWTVDGRPLAAFHFSGYSLADPYTLSRHDRRNSLYILPSLARLIDHYGARLLASGAAEDLRLPYRFAAFPSGIEVDERMRRIFKQHETALRADLSPWTAAGEAHYCAALLSPIPYNGSLLPALFDAVYQERPDVQRSYPEARLRPDSFWRWIAQHGIYEHGYQEIYDRHRPAVPSRHGVVTLARARREHPRLFAGLPRPLGADRHRLLARLDAHGPRALAAAVRGGGLEHNSLAPVALVRRLVEERADVRRAFPDLLFSDAAAFGRWLAGAAARDHCLPAEAAAQFLARAEGRSLARIFSFVNRTRDVAERWPLGLVGEGCRELAETLLRALRHPAEHDADDVAMYLWVMAEQPWAGIGLTCELAVNVCRTPSPLLDEGQEALLAPLLGRDRRFRAALERFRREHRGAEDRRGAARARRMPRTRTAPGTVLEALAVARQEGMPESGAAPAAVAAIAIGGAHRAPAAIPAPLEPLAPLAAPAPGGGRLRASSSLLGVPPPERRGINLFGYHRSPIGLGTLSRGLGLALGRAGVEVRPNVLGNAAMAADLAPADFVRVYDHRLDTNLFVSYPHQHEMLLAGQPAHVTHGRRNVVHLAWEQRDGSPYWPEVYRDFDQVWALSDFAAASLRRYMRREVATVPCVLDCDALPAPGSKQDFGLDPGKLTLVYVFDANSSVERKNPEAVLRACGRAFAGQDDVCLVLRIANGNLLHHRERIRRLLAAAPRGLDLRLAVEPMAHADLLRLLSAGDAYVSLHRAEGFGYTCAEAMAYGLPVVATGYSGNLQFMDRDSAFLVEAREAAVEVADGPYQRGSVWAEPDVEHAAALLRLIYDRPELARSTGARGRERVRQILSPAAVGRTALAALGWEAGAAAGAAGDTAAAADRAALSVTAASAAPASTAESAAATAPDPSRFLMPAVSGVRR